jgi:hypothetical protein
MRVDDLMTSAGEPITESTPTPASGPDTGLTLATRQ